MIKIAQTPTYPATVNVELPDGKTVKKVAFTINFHRKTMTEITDIHRRLGLPMDNDEKLNDEKLVGEIVAGWGTDVQDEDGQPLEFNDANLAALMDIYPVRPAVVRTFFETLNGGKAKN